MNTPYRRAANAAIVVSPRGEFLRGNGAAGELSQPGESIATLFVSGETVIAALNEAVQSGDVVVIDEIEFASGGSISLRVIPLPDGDGRCLIDFDAESTQLEPLEEAARQNDLRVQRLSEQLVTVTRELLNRTAQLAEQKQKIDAIINGMEEGLLGCDEQGRIIQINETAARLLQLEPSRVMQHPLHEAHPFTANAIGFDPDQPGALSRRNVNFTVAGRDIRVFSSPIVDETTGFKGFVLILLDRTKQAELDQMKADIISIVSHEMRSPLTSIKGYIDLLIGGDVGEVPESMMSYLGIVSQNANRLSSLIDDMLDLSRLEAGKLDMSFGRVDVNYLCDSVYLSMKPQAEAKRLEFRRDVETGLMVSGDVDRLQQALGNLTSNAIKYTPEGGMVAIEAMRENEGVILRVIDSGIGISANDQQRLFQKFFRVKNAKTRNIGGTGLGLCIARTIVEAHEGRIVIESSEGAGSKFTILLPEYQS